MEKPEQQLAQLRARIDALDESIAQLLIERTGVIHEVAALKSAHWPKDCHIRPGREGQMHRAIVKRFAGSDIPPIVALSIWRQLIGASTHLESPLAVTVTAPEHVAYARDYFGVQVKVTHAKDLAQALETVAQGKSNILILPSPTQSDWWYEAAKIQAAGLSIFASLPVMENTEPRAVALATVTPEPSGDDISYHVADNQLFTREGFVSAPAGGIFLGAHPRPIKKEDLA